MNHSTIMNPIQIGSWAENVRACLASAWAEGIFLIAVLTGLMLSLILVFPVLAFSWRGGRRCLHGGRAGRISDRIAAIFAVFPPVFWGVLLVGFFGVDGLTGRGLVHALSWSGWYPWLGALLAAVLAAVPVWYLAFSRALDGTSRELLQAAKTLGIRKRKIFWKIVMPGAARGIWQGMILGAFRAVGEYGACALVARSLLKTGGEAAKEQAGHGLFGIPGSTLGGALLWDLGCLAAGGILCLLFAALMHARAKRRSKRSKLRKKQNQRRE